MPKQLLIAQCGALWAHANNPDMHGHAQLPFVQCDLIRTPHGRGDGELRQGAGEVVPNSRGTESRPACLYHTFMATEQIPNPFEILGLPTGYALDHDMIERAYRSRLTKFHPDAGGGGESDSATLNKARRVLLDDEQRAIALLDALGGPDARLCKDLPDGFLMGMMMQRQEIEEAIESGGDVEREEWEQWGIEQRRDYRTRVGSMFDGLEDDPSEESLNAIRVELNAWRYIERLIEQLDPEYDPARADLS
jgi:DnaJ-domain-containing protein 1